MGPHDEQVNGREERWRQEERERERLRDKQVVGEPQRHDVRVSAAFDAQSERDARLDVQLNGRS